MMFVPSVEAVRITINLLDKYKEKETIEDALKPNYTYLSPEDFLQEHFMQINCTEELKDDVAELFFRISKYRKYLEIIVNEFLTSKSPWISGTSKEFSLYLVLLYFFVIELNELTKTKIEDLVILLNEKKALGLLVFFKRSNILRKLYEWGCRIWDVDYVNNVLKNIIQKPLYKELYESITIHSQKIKDKQTKRLTVPVGPKCLYRQKKSFNVSEPFASSPLITRIPVTIKASRVPDSTYQKPKQIERVEKFRAKHQKRAKELWKEAQNKAFRVAEIKKSEKVQELVDKLEAEKTKIPVRRSFKKIKPKNVQNPKKTAAVILREGARLLKLEQEEIKRYEDLESGGFNNNLISKWEEEIREENFRKHMEEIEKKHLEGLLTYEEALLAKQKCLKKKKESADEFRKEKEVWLKQLETLKKEEQLRIQESVEKGKTYEKGAKEAKEQVKEQKHKLALETMEESKLLKERWLKEKEEELQRKIQLIKEIKALQALGCIRKKQTDFTETANLGLLYEMSIVELKERLFLLQIEMQEDLDKRKAEVKLKREYRKEMIDSYQDLIESHQRIVEENRKSINNKEKVEDKKEIKESYSLENLRRKLWEKRRERLKI